MLVNRQPWTVVSCEMLRNLWGVRSKIIRLSFCFVQISNSCLATPGSLILFTLGKMLENTYVQKMNRYTVSRWENNKLFSTKTDKLGCFRPSNDLFFSCCSEGPSCKVVFGMISETVNIEKHPSLRTKGTGETKRTNFGEGVNVWNIDAIVRMGCNFRQFNEDMFSF